MIWYQLIDEDLLSLGADAGSADVKEDGLSRFKSGWPTGTRTTYLFGRICDQERYAALATNSRQDGVGASDGYFPAYRSSQISTAR